MANQLTPAALNAAATVALTGSWPSHCHYDVRYAAERAGLVEFIYDDEERRRAPGAYRATDAGRAAIAKSRLWQAAEYLRGQEFALDRGKRVKPGFVQFTRDDGARAFISSGRRAYVSAAGQWQSQLVFENGKAVQAQGAHGRVLESCRRVRWPYRPGAAQMSRRHPYDQAADRELAKWPGVVVLDRATMPSGHRRLALEYKGKRRFIVYPGTPRDSTHGPKNHVRDIRRVLRAIDEERN